MKTSALVLGLGTALVSMNVFAGNLPLESHIRVDRADDSLDGTCQRGLAIALHCNLRAAIAAALTQEGSVIDIHIDSVITQGPIAIAPQQATNLIIHGSTSDPLTKITGTAATRLFEINDQAFVQMNGVAVSNFSSSEGGAILNSGTLELQSSTFAGNKVVCSGSGAMTAFATCFGGAISNKGTLILKDQTHFENNDVSAAAWTASFTTATASGGAISSSGNLIIDGTVVFEGNSAHTSAFSGIHPMPAGGATSNAFGGAVASEGSLEVTESGLGKCLFAHNVAKAVGATHFGELSLTSRGGAAFVSGATSFAGTSCVFTDNAADQDVDLAFIAN